MIGLSDRVNYQINFEVHVDNIQDLRYNPGNYDYEKFYSSTARST